MSLPIQTVVYVYMDCTGLASQLVFIGQESTKMGVSQNAPEDIGNIPNLSNLPNPNQPNENPTQPNENQTKPNLPMPTQPNPTQPNENQIKPNQTKTNQNINCIIQIDLFLISKD